MTTRIRFAATTLAAALTLAHATTRAAGDADGEPSLEDLLNTKVTTVSRKSQSLQSTAAAAFVITREDIERSGVTSLPEALRMAPGVQVARLANNRWAVTVRGFNGRFANKLLVLMDGRSIYSPLFSGVMWEFEDTLLEDVERIEVIRGPGASLWGANAVNGVINIISRKARDTQGELLVAAAGTTERALVAGRHGGEVDDGHYRAWAKAIDRDPAVTLAGEAGNDDWRSVRGGFRRDWSRAAGNRSMLSGEAYSSVTNDRWNVADLNSPQGFTPTDIEQAGVGGHLLGRHEWVQDDGSEAALQSYIVYEDIDVKGALHQKRITFDLDFQRRVLLDARNDFIWGLGYRFTRDDVLASGMFSLTPQNRRLSLFSAFVQDEFTVVPDTLRVIAGARLEHNDTTGFEPQPNLRMVWTPTPSQSVWSALSRAVRTPSRAEQDVQVDLSVTPAMPPFVPFPVLTRNVAPPDGTQRSEKVNTLELGYRQQMESNLSFDVAVFYSRYKGLRSAKLGGQQVVMSASPYIVQEISPASDVDARTHGLELALDWHPLPWWRLQPNYTFLEVWGRTRSDDIVTLADAASIGGSAPRHQWSVRSSMSLGRSQQWDLWLRRVGALANADQAGNAIEAYTTLDLRWAWRATPALELSLVGQNLLQRRHAEFVPELLPSQTLQVERSAYVKAKLQF